MISKLILPLAMAATLLSGCGNSPEGVIQKFYEGVEKGSTTTVKETLSKQVLAMFDEAKLTAAVLKAQDEIKGCGGIAGIAVQLRGDGDARLGSTTVTYKGQCKPKKEKASVIKEDSKWKIALAK